ncbi:tRNA lysidine(34) synthetase TilS [Synechococcus sp. CBW1107]|uniref:tRNA lysidine(34) synthetase TilS n=1 Tax=Synechococcus sp. CBW1107 TaxID=2789857 RepID=UPI0018CF37C7|nr:tRNA lysidine(34) synthetase TilS [Synechococcus sp. CBW1107]QPN57984.1 tRNA lysidine(34) synthetase TilS [Synechococcus sp. CBW1107]CAK6688179.1 tRNA(Ile)-lysidine synthase [Synechococcus sp. CBW1107]
MEAILPWGPLQHRLHRRLLKDPQLLPRGRRLLLAVSGGQDSMALTTLLLELQRLHDWDLHLWHGNHGWRKEAADQAGELTAWAASLGLPMRVENAATGPASRDISTEEAGRRWRYERLNRQALSLGCTRVVTGHTGSDRAETLLFNLARGCGLRGLSSLRASRPLSGSIALVRPLLGFSRAETASYCEQQQLPLWLDPGNDDPRFSRNRLRQEVMPVLEELHPGAWRRLGALAERLEGTQELTEELARLALVALQTPAGPLTAGEPPQQGPGLQRQWLSELSARSQELLLDLWLERSAGVRLGARSLESLRRRLPLSQGPGSLTLPGGSRLVWDRQSVRLQPEPNEPADPSGPPEPGAVSSPSNR